MQSINRMIAAERALGEGYAIGHSFFCSYDGSGDSPIDWARRVYAQEIRPLLEEYCVEHPRLAAQLLAEIPAL